MAAPVGSLRSGLVRPAARVAVVLAVLGLALVGVTAGQARAATFTVTKTADTNDGTCNSDCSLREAISAANAASGADTISLPAGTYQLTIPNAGGNNEDANATGDLDILGSLTIQGAGSGTTIIEAGTNTTNGIDKVIAVNPICTTTMNVTIDAVTVRFGRNTQPSGAPDFSFTGGGIDWCDASTGGTFTLSNSVVSDNTNVNGYGGGLNVDTVSAPTTVNITNDTFQNNKTLSTTDTANGGAINLFGDSPTVTITNSTFTSNSTANSTSGGGAIYFRPTTIGHLTITGSTFTSNTAAGIGGAIAADSHGTGTTISIQSSTFTGNTATNSFGGAMKLDGTTLNTTPFSLTHLKITGNTAGISGGGLFVGQSNVTMSKSLIVGNSAPTGSGLHKSVDAATATVTDNWWGCSTGPSAAPCDTATTAGGTLSFSPWYRDQLTATTSPVAVNQSTSLTASFLTDSGNSAVPVADLSEIIGRSVAWAATHGNLSSTQSTVQAAGTATGSFQATSAGTAVISAKVDNDNTAPVSSNVLSLTVNKADTTAAITDGATLSGTASVTGQPVTVTYSVTGAFGNSPTAPTGNVTVSDGTDSCTGTVAAGTCDVTFRTAGSKTLTATYAGDTNFNASPASTSASHTVNKADTTTTISSDNPDPSVTGQTVTFNVSVSANAPGAAVSPTTITGTVSVSDGGTNSCNATLTAGSGSCTIAFPSVAPYSMTASYGGDSNFNGSTSVANSHTVNKADTTTTITSDSPDPSDVGQSVTVDFTVAPVSPGAGTPTGNVTVSDGVDSCIGTVATGTCDLALTKPGARTLTATYAGDGDFNGSTSADESHTVTPPVIQDTTPAATYTITGTSGPDDVTVQDGPVVDGFQTVEILIGAFTYDLANKTAITVNTGGGADTVTIDNPTAADGVSTITVNGEGDDDAAHVIATEPGVTTTVDTGAGTGDTVDVGSTLNGIAGELDVVDAGDGGTATLDDSADTGQNVVTISTGIAGTITYVTGASPGDIEVTGMGSIGLSLGSGNDTLRIQGTDPNVSYDLSLGSGNDALAMLGSAAIASGSPIDGGGGTDTVKYNKHSSGVSVDLSAGTATATPGLTGFENITGSPFPDTLTGDGGNNVIAGTGGGDLISGLGGGDSLMGTPGNDTISGGDGNDRLSGAGGDDHLMGDAGDDSLGGGPGADVLEGGAGNDILKAKDRVSGNDSADGGPDTDTCTADPGDTVTNCEG